MEKRFLLPALLMSLVMFSTATAQQAKAPRIASWSNSKTSNKKTVF